MREFNTFGPVNPLRHYHVNRVAVKAALREKIEKGRYLTLNAGRQTGKTTLFREIIAELEAEGSTFGILLDFEALAGFGVTDFYEQLRMSLEEWRTFYCPSAPEPSPLAHQGDWVRWLRKTIQQVGKRCILIIDEFDALPVNLVAPILAQLREMYLQRDHAPVPVVHSVVLVGVRTIPSLLGGTQSPFNIADQFTVPYFTPEEVADLLTQHTTEHGQAFAQEVIKGVVQETEGQPYLVNRLGQLLTQEINPDVHLPITTTHLEYALARLVNENNTHFASIRSKAALHRPQVLTMLFNPARYYDFQDEVTQELVMYGILRVLRDEQGIEYARMANPIYRKMLVKTFAPTHALIKQATNGSIQNLFLTEGELQFDRLLDHFKAFMQEHGVRLLKSEKTERPLEISGQYLLLSYLTAALQSLGGYAVVESVSSAGEIDILAFYRGRRFIIETKIWYGEKRYQVSKEQLVHYLRAASLDKGYLVIFDEKLDENPLRKTENETFETTLDHKLIRVYLIGIATS
jgi:hypothetical protein